MSSEQLIMTLAKGRIAAAWADGEMTLEETNSSYTRMLVIAGQSLAIFSASSMSSLDVRIRVEQGEDKPCRQPR